MGRLAQFCVGPAGSGKSTFCEAFAKHVRGARRGGCTLVNLDPAAENLCYRPDVDVRDLISLEDTNKLKLGPNGGLVFCIEYLASNLSWLKDALQSASPNDDEHFVIDCPGQIELYTHVPAMKKIIKALQTWGYAVCGTFLVDAAMVVGDIGKYLSAVLLATSSMIQLEMPWICALSKVDLISDEDAVLFCDVNYNWIHERLQELESLPSQKTPLASQLHRLNRAICSLVEDVSMVRFFPLDSNDSEKLDIILQQLDVITQYGEDLEPRDPKDVEEAEEEDVRHDE